MHDYYRSILREGIAKFLIRVWVILLTCSLTFMSALKIIEWSKETDWLRPMVKLVLVREPVFSERDFDNDTLKILCSAIKQDQYVFPQIKAQGDTIHWLNEVLTITDLYKQIYEKKMSGRELTQEMTKLWGALDTKSLRTFTQLAPGDKEALVRLNRLILQRAYINKVPKTLKDHLYPFYVAAGIAFLVLIWRILRYIGMGYIECKTYPGNKLCEPIHNYLTNNQHNRLRDKGGNRIPMTLEGKCSLSFKGNMQTYLRVIEDIAPNYSFNHTVGMTLPYSPYEQINQLERFEAFRRAMLRVKSTFLGHSKHKLIILSKDETAQFIKDFAKDFQEHREKLEFKKYLRLHYRKRLFSKMLFNVDLRWKIEEHGDTSEEFIYIYRKANKNKQNGIAVNYDKKGEKIKIDFESVEYQDFDNDFKEAYSTKTFFKDKVLPEITLDNNYMKEEMTRMVSSW